MTINGRKNGLDTGVLIESLFVSDLEEKSLAKIVAYSFIYKFKTY